MTMAISATFNPTAGLLTALGDGLDDTITASRDAAGNILVNGGAVPVAGGTPTVANTTNLQLFGQGGNDTLTLDETNGALPAAQLLGGAGNDVLTGGSGDDELFGQAGNDTLNGKGGNDLLFGGAGNDVLTGGAGNDQVFGGAGNDRLIWNPGDGSDLFEGGDGTDTAEVNGGNGSETFTITANGGRVRFDRVSPAPFSLDIGTTENLVVNANGGDDVITAGNGLAGLVQLTIDGGAGNDTITGGDGNDILIGGDGNDVITGGRGADTARLGAGDDKFVWNPGDGNDTVEGQDGADTLVFNGANVAEKIAISANGSRASFTRDIANITMDLNGIERIEFNALGGSDNVVVNNLARTDVTQVAIDLAATLGGATSDGQLDTVTVNGTTGSDHIVVTASGTAITVSGLSEVVTIDHADATDQLSISGGAGSDTIDASTVPAGTMAFVLDGGAGSDTLIGSRGADQLIGGDGNDVVTGGMGDDTALLGTGNDQFVWNPGDGSDVVEGQDGTDTLLFNGSNAGETVDISANGGRVRFFRDVGNITMDLNDIEFIDVQALGGADNAVLNDTTGTDLKTVAFDLEAAIGGGSGDGAADSITVNGTNNPDDIQVTAIDNVVEVNGAPVTVQIAHSEAANDLLAINALDGNDNVAIGGGVAALIQTLVDLGPGE
jgi:Ca2+-binding RTX toxin-like protein